MNPKKFHQFFIPTTMLSALGIVGSGYVFPNLAIHQELAWALLIFYAFFVWFSYMIGQRVAALPDGNKYSRFILSMIGLKMLATIVIVVAYAKSAGRENARDFVIYFLALYIIFTVLEVYVLSKLAYLKK